MSVDIAAASVAMNYRRMAASLEVQAATERTGGRPLKAAVTRFAAKVARRAADAEMKNPEPA